MRDELPIESACDFAIQYHFFHPSSLILHPSSLILHLFHSTSIATPSTESMAPPAARRLTFS
jgi:hypothetical protein